MKKIAALLFALALFGCGKDEGVYYFVPEIEMASGEVAKTNAFPVPTLEDCVKMAGLFEQDMMNDPDVISYSSDCVRSAMKLKAPTEQPGMTHNTKGTI